MQLTDQEKADLRADMTEAARKMDEVFDAIEQDTKEPLTAPPIKKGGHSEPLEGYSYPCLHCGREKGAHKGITFHCPLSRTQFTSFSRDVVYTPNLAKPKKKGFTI